jgi:Flp pilus assembly protein TadD
VNPEKAENWLGLALSEEKLGNSNLAREAYQQALNKNTLKESIVKYINQRLIELR